MLNQTKRLAEMASSMKKWRELGHHALPIKYVQAWIDYVAIDNQEQFVGKDCEETALNPDYWMNEVMPFPADTYRMKEIYVVPLEMMSCVGYDDYEPFWNPPEIKYCSNCGRSFSGSESPAINRCLECENAENQWQDEAEDQAETQYSEGTRR